MPARGTGVINVNGREVQILFTNRALLAAEKQMGKGILGMLQGFMDGHSGIGDLQALLRAGMEAARQDAGGRGKPISNENALDIIDEIGFTEAITPVMNAVAEVISYNSQAASGEQVDDPN